MFWMGFLRSQWYSHLEHTFCMRWVSVYLKWPGPFSQTFFWWRSRLVWSVVLLGLLVLGSSLTWLTFTISITLASRFWTHERDLLAPFRWAYCTRQMTQFKTLLLIMSAWLLPFPCSQSLLPLETTVSLERLLKMLWQSQWDFTFVFQISGPPFPPKKLSHMMHKYFMVLFFRLVNPGTPLVLWPFK